MEPRVTVLAVRGAKSATAHIIPTAPRGARLIGGCRPAYEDIEHLLTDWPIRCQEPIRPPHNGRPEPRDPDDDARRA